jgi:cobyrinic acid a,c-diamide synthase
VRAIVIAAPQSGSGKTTVTVGIMDLLKRRGLKVAPFKVGPDFIDPGYHRLVTGVASLNLDAWISPPGFVKESFARHAAGADIAVIEGVMGLFDGIEGGSDAGSTAQIAKLLGAPVLLVIDAGRQAGSVAALANGFAGFDPSLRVAGVILNNVGSPNHQAILSEALAAGCPKLPIIGCIPRDPALAIASRHLGLVTAEEEPLSPSFRARLAEVMDRHLDLDLLLRIAGTAAPVLTPALAPRAQGEPVRIAVARDAAFCFVYEENLRLLEEQGGELVPFSPLADPGLPKGCCGVYLPGGYPELYHAALAANLSLKEELRRVVESGMPCYAECGGFIYLSRGIRFAEGLAELVGIFPVAARMLPRRKALGYREVEFTADGPLGPAGTRARGHEFHYSEMEPMPAEVERLYRVTKRGADLGTEGYRYQNCLASYIHLHFGSASPLAEGFVESCRGYQQRSRT